MSSTSLPGNRWLIQVSPMLVLLAHSDVNDPGDLVPLALAALGITFFGDFIFSAFSRGIELPSGLTQVLSEQASRRLGDTDIVPNLEGRSHADR